MPRLATPRHASPPRASPCHDLLSLRSSWHGGLLSAFLNQATSGAPSVEVPAERPMVVLHLA
eukprot:15338521-Alexandrium_andersonii.AAC.1